MATAAQNQAAMEYIVTDLARRLTEVTTKLEAVADKGDDTYARKDIIDQLLAASNAMHEVLKAKDAELERRLDGIDEDKKWITRLIISLVVVAVLGVVLGVKKAAGL